MSAPPERSEIDPEYRWDLESVYETDEQWETAFEAAADQVEELAGYDEDDVTDAESLRTVLKLRDDLLREVSTIAAYARMRSDEDTRKSEYQAMSGRAQSLSAEASSAASFIEPAIQSFDREKITAMLEEDEELEVYDHYLDDVLRMKPHTRSPEVEELLADLSEVTGAASDVYQMLTDADMEFPTVEDPDGEPVEITTANFTKLQKRPDRAFRQTVYEAFYDEWETVRNAIGTAHEKSVKADVKIARIRDYDSAREASLHGPNVPVEVYDTLVDTVRENLGVLDRHARLKRRALDVDELRMWDLYMPVAAGESPTVEYDEAASYVTEAVDAIGDDYRERVATGLDSRWVDVYENRGKRSGAYSSGTYDTQPFILMNYQDDVSSMYTLAHELGHSLHSELTSEQQPYVYSGYEIFVAEVASTVNEVLLTRHLLETVDDDHLRRHILDEYLERFRSTLFRQTMFAAFEQRTHELVEEGEALTADRLDELYGGLKGEFYESAVVDDRIAREWMRIPHFYWSFYVYQYATGISAAVALADSILEEGEPAAERYLEFLQRGSRAYPLELLEDAGVDMTTADPIEAAIAEYDARLDELEALL